MTQVHRIVLMIVDHDGLGGEGVEEVLENTRYPNHCIAPQVMECQTRTVEWHDQHPLNLTSQQGTAFRKLFES